MSLALEPPAGVWASAARALAAGRPLEALDIVLQAVRELLAAESAAVLRAEGERLVPLCGDAPAGPGVQRWPLRTAGGVEGTLAVAAAAPARLAAATNVLPPLLDLAALALRDLRLEAERREQRLRTESFVELARESSTTRGVDAVLDHLAIAACRLLGADFAAAYVLEADGYVTRRSLSGVRVPPDDRQRRTRPYGLVARVLEHGTTQVFADLASAGPRGRLPLFDREDGRAAVGIPLRRNGTLKGALLLGWRRPLRLSAEEVRLAEALAAYGATVLDRAQAHAVLDAVVEQMPSGLIVLDRSGCVELVNRAARQILGVSLDPATPLAEQLPRFQLRHARDGRPLQPAESSPRRVLAGEVVDGAEYVLRRPDTGEDAWLRCWGVPLHDAQGVVSGGVLVFTDVTRERQLVERLAASEERFRIALHSAPITVFQMDAALRYTWVYHPQRGMERPLLGCTDAELFPPAAAAQLTTLKQSVLDTGVGRREEVRVELDGRRLYYDLCVEPLRDADERVVGLTGAMVDITARKREQETLQRLAAIVESSDDAIIGTAPDGTIVSWNRAAEQYYGYTAAEACGQHITLIVPPEEHVLIAERRARVLAGERVVVWETQRVDRDGHRIDVAVSIFPVTDADGQIVGTASIARDITASKRAAEALQRSEQFARAVLNALPAEIAALDRGGVISAVNDAWAQAAPSGRGLVRALVGQSYLAACAALSDDAPYAAEAAAGIAAVLSGARPRYSLEYSCDIDGEPRWFALYVTPLGGDRGGAVLAHLDITERKVVEEQFRQVQRLDAMGRLAGGVAHDFNNLLTAINGFAELLLSQLPTVDPRRAFADEILKAGERAADLAGQLLAFSRRQPVSPQILDLNAVVRDTETLLRRLIGEDIVLITRLDPTCGAVRADYGQLQQVLVNLAVNARDAMPRGGELVLETRRVQLKAQAAAAAGLPQAGPHVALVVRDTGCGMDAATQARIFEPFFTTKQPGRGTGLGLSTVYGIVKQSRGAIGVTSQPGCGATFTLYLPEVAEHPHDVPAPEPVSAPARGTETILLVEDEAQVRALARTCLIEAGYTVLEARDGAEALAVSARHSGPLHLLLTDVVMPGMSGSELAQVLRARCPGLGVLYISGYPDETIAERGMAEPHALLLAKPFTPEQLRAQVRRILDRRAAG